MNKHVLLMALFVVVFIRFTTLDDYALTDTTEARYGEVARVMVKTGQWLMPQLVPGEPFWAKPPLSFWQGAASIKLLGVSEFALRLPPFINMLGVLALTYLFSRTFGSTNRGILAALITASTATGILVSGAVMTDHAMLLGTTLSFYSFWMLANERGKIWAYLFTAGLVVAFLAKGPIAIVMSLVPVCLWISLRKKWIRVWELFPVSGCIAMFTMLALPWFLIAENITPGYLHYYFVGEHIYRYLIPGWEGDLYGNAHEQPYGKIWLFGFAAFLPWTIVMAALFLKKVSLWQLPTLKVTSTYTDASLTLYLLLWLFWPLIFFSLSSNILHTYVLTGLPAFGILAAMYLGPRLNPLSIAAISVILPVTLLVTMPLGLGKRLETSSQKSSLDYVGNHWPDAEVVYTGSIPHSARFYSRGDAQFEENLFDIKSRLSSNRTQVVFVKTGIQFKHDSPLVSIPELKSRRFQGYILKPVKTSKVRYTDGLHRMSISGAADTQGDYSM